MRIICNPYGNQISYHFLNENGAWVVLSGDSPLSRQFFTNATMREKAGEIVRKIDEIYNRKNRGLDIYFEGVSEEYSYLLEAIRVYLPGRDISCKFGTTKIAVIGKAKTGKTTLVTAMEEMQKCKYTVKETPEYHLYKDEGNHAEWYEIKGIDLGIEAIEQAYRTTLTLIEHGVSILAYCVSANTKRLEEEERDLILRLIKNHPQITVLIVVTMAVKRNIEAFSDEIEKMTNQIKVVPTLACEFEMDLDDSLDEATKTVVIKPHGLEELAKYIFERR